MRADNDTLMTTEDVATRFALPVESVQALARSGELPGFKVGKAWRFRRSTLEKWERQREREAAP